MVYLWQEIKTPQVDAAHCFLLYNHLLYPHQIQEDNCLHHQQAIGNEISSAYTITTFIMYTHISHIATLYVSSKLHVIGLRKLALFIQFLLELLVNVNT